VEKNRSNEKMIERRHGYTLIVSVGEVALKRLADLMQRQRRELLSEYEN
jgi:hypothetical protein